MQILGPEQLGGIDELNYYHGDELRMVLELGQQHGVASLWFVVKIHLHGSMQVLSFVWTVLHF